MQKAYKLYFSANLQLVIGKVSNNLKEKKKVFVSPASPPTQSQKEEKPEQNKRITGDFGIIYKSTTSN